ncbi:hypothetical protein M758_1G178900 [Ceratodon purpureus]|uniref:VOC domain-containing protein n=1 Tax=Ceratodon purpureus TaxID=3225 RepID=A0A8T0J9E1_CERPU|nr:hypothetical protein KC19_1G181800 [Ceratodon purpureus]KAG0630453.1 hypothetical protein M758_1G178900 [Ceratodon purpureus]
METKPKEKRTLPLKSLNHVSRVCRDVNATTYFYEHVLGFIPIKRPGSFDFDGAWLHNYGISIHLLQAEKTEVETLPPVKEDINPRDDHLSFQSDSVEKVEQALHDHEIKYEKNTIDENGIVIEQVFFHDPDGFMIEICTCEKFPVQPLNGATTELCNLVRTLSRRKSGLPSSRPISRTSTADQKLIPDQLKAF